MIKVMESIIRSLNNKKSKTLLFYLIYVLIISTLLFIGLSGSIHADTFNNQQDAAQQYRNQNRPVLVVKTVHYANHHHHYGNWFRDGLDNHNLRDRGWVSWHESRDRWHVLSYGRRCIGYFQLDPRYLGYRHGHVNLHRRHQVRVADAYAKSRYGNWINAKHFWQAHHWY